MEDKIIKSIFKYAQKDKVRDLAIGYFDLNKNSIIKDNYSQSGISNSETLFELGSLTKLFTALVYGIMQEKKEIDITKSVNFYLGQKYSREFHRISIKNLLTHTSGLPRVPKIFLDKMQNFDDPYSALTKDDLYAYLTTPTEISQANKYRYSNLGYGILGEILSQMHNKPYEEIIIERLLSPLKMNYTNVLKNIHSRNIITGYNELNCETKYWNNEILAGAGCFFSNITDMMSLLLSHITEKNISSIPLPTITNELLSKKMSYGWHIKNSFLSKLIGYSGFYWHNGMTGGFSSFCCIHKQKRSGLIILANKPIHLDSYFYNFTSYV